jgi:hypothetical protein
MMSGLAGLQVGNSKVKKYEKAIEEGELLVMVDIAKARIDEISQIIISNNINKLKIRLLLYFFLLHSFF